MTEKKDNGGDKGKAAFDPEKRFRYVGFEVYQGKKIKGLFKSESEQKGWVQRVLDKRAKGNKIREHTQFDVPRVAGYEKIVLAIASVVLIASLFFPWFSGHTEYIVETEKPVVEEAVIDSTMVDSLADSMAVLADLTTDTIAVADEEAVAAVLETEVAGEDPSTSLIVSEKDEKGFTSIASVRIRKEIKREYFNVSALGALGLLGSHGGDIFSSGFVVIITAILIIIYMLFCVFSAGYALYLIFLGDKNADKNALQLKKGLRLNWLPIAIWACGLVISFVGASYAFDTSEMVTQIGESYGPATYLGLLSYGFYISIAVFVLSATKAAEI